MDEYSETQEGNFTYERGSIVSACMRPAQHQATQHPGLEEGNRVLYPLAEEILAARGWRVRVLQAYGPQEATCRLQHTHAHTNVMKWIPWVKKNMKLEENNV